MKITAPFALILVFGTASAQVGWHEIPHVTGRSDHAVAFDEARAVLVLFGGVKGSSVFASSDELDDTWEWDGEAWELRTPATRPPARRNHRMVYDSWRGRVVLFGGREGFDYKSDTWEWDGTDWVEVQPVRAPGPRAEHGMAFDRARNRTVLFGGHLGGIKSADTWEYDGTNWTEVVTTIRPPERAEHDLAWHDGSQGVLLWGGQWSQGGLQLADTWWFDGSQWISLNPQTVPPARSRYLLEEGPGGTVVLFGGFRLIPHGATVNNDTWVWNGTDWVPAAPVTMPEPRERIDGAYDRLRGTLVMFGGASNPFAAAPETWSWSGSDWSMLSAGPRPSLAWTHRLVWGPNRDRLLHVGAAQNNVVETWEWTGRTWDRIPHATRPPWRHYTAVAADTSRDRVVMFGGWANILLGDTWEFDGTDWTERQPATTPPPLTDHAMVFDTRRDRAVMFGGGSYSPDTYLAQTWEWDGDDWALQQPATSPSPRRSASMVFVDHAGVTLLFGGRDANSYLDDTWFYDGNDWTLIDPATKPSPRSGASMTYDAAKQRVVLVGGDTVSAADTWEFTGSTWVQRAPSPDLTDRSLHAIGYDRARERVVLSGGMNPATQLGIFDTWEYYPDDPAGWIDLGAGCPGSAGTPDLVAVNRPWIGSTFALELRNLPPTGGAILYFGFSDQRWGPFGLPFDLGVFGATGCTLFISADVTVPVPNTGGQARLDVPIPPSPALVGFEFWNQGLVFDPGVNLLSVVYSDAGRAKVGAQ